MVAVALASTVVRSEDELALPKGLEPTIEEPELPAGLQPAIEELMLPAGLDGMETADEPPLPDGLENGDETSMKESAAAATLPFELSGFVDGRIGHRTQSDGMEPDFSLGELRTQIEAEKSWGEPRRVSPLICCTTK